MCKRADKAGLADPATIVLKSLQSEGQAVHDYGKDVQSRLTLASISAQNNARARVAAGPAMLEVRAAPVVEAREDDETMSEDEIVFHDEIVSDDGMVSDDEIVSDDEFSLDEDADDDWEDLQM